MYSVLWQMLGIQGWEQGVDLALKELRAHEGRYWWRWRVDSGCQRLYPYPLCAPQNSQRRTSPCDGIGVSGTSSISQSHLNFMEMYFTVFTTTSKMSSIMMKWVRVITIYLLIREVQEVKGSVYCLNGKTGRYPQWQPRREAIIEALCPWNKNIPPLPCFSSTLRN